MSIQQLAQAHGPQAPVTLLLLMAAPCLLPVPGVGTVLGIGLGAFALTLWRGQAEDCLPRRVAGLELSAEWSRRVLMFLVATYLVAGRYSRPRISAFAACAQRSWLGPAVAAMAAMILGLATAALAIAANSALVMLACYLGSDWLPLIVS